MDNNTWMTEEGIFPTEDFANFSGNLTLPIQTDPIVIEIYRYAIPPMVTICLVSVIINIKILSSSSWIRGSISPTLHISLSLAAADAYASTLLAVGLIMNSWLPKLYDIHSSDCASLTIEALRLGGVVTTIGHLLALAANHYLGIMRPLHYASIVTYRYTVCTLIILWIAPPIFFFAYFCGHEGDGFMVENCRFDFMLTLNYRLILGMMIVMPLLVMMAVYAHILMVVRRHQATRLRFSTMGSRHGRQPNSMGRQQNGGSVRCRQEQQLARNVKAIFTTLLILGSYAIGLVPGVLHIVMFCDDGCPFSRNDMKQVNHVILGVIVNSLIILKTLANPIIYAARMQEIKSATRRMHERSRCCCCCCCLCCLPATSDNDRRDDALTRTSTMPANAQRAHSHRSQDYRKNSRCQQTGIITTNATCPLNRRESAQNFRRNSEMNSMVDSSNNNQRRISRRKSSSGLELVNGRRGVSVVEVNCGALVTML